MLIAGVDLAAEPKATALAVIEFSNKDEENPKAKLSTLELGVTDQQIVSATNEAQKIGIDCAFGWPTEFVEFLNQNQDIRNKEIGKAQTPISGAMEWRRRMAYRETDRQIREITGRWPLSVSTDRLGLTAMRNAGLLARLQEAGVDTTRDGTGTTVEVYPGATLRLWSFDTTGYRATEQKRQELLASLKAQAFWLELSQHQEQLMIESTDCFDAVIAALAARAVALGKYHKPTDQQTEKAQVEGWICLPSVGLGEI